MKKKIYFADLTYIAGVVSCDLLPLGCGYVATYANTLFGAKCDIKIFRYPEELLKVVEKDPPDIFAGSCYAWNKNLILLTSRLIKERNPQCLIVLGGPAFPLDIKRQKEFLSENKHVGFFIPYDGEIGFANVLETYLSFDGDEKKMRRLSIPGAICLDDRNEIVVGEKTKRPKDLDIFPSPYLTGLFDSFLKDNKFTPMIQSTRGCPHRCSYCWASNEQNRCISSFSLERVYAELNYVAGIAVKNNIYDLVICDSNFGLYERDYKIVDRICYLQRNFNYPKIFGTALANKGGPQFVKHSSMLEGVSYCLSVQSTDPKILENIKRKKVDLKEISECVKAVHDIKKYISTEIITGLPYETRATHMTTIRELMDCGFDFIDPFTFMLLDGIELDSEQAHKKFQYDIRYRLIPRDFGKINDKYSFEIETVVVGTNTYNFEDYLYFRNFHGLLRLLVNNDTYKELLQYIKQHGVNLLDWFIFIFDDLRNNPSRASECFSHYADEARSELWNSPEELIQYYSQEENYKKLIRREIGDNLMQKYSVLASSIYFSIYVDYFFDMAKHYLECSYKEKKHDILNEISDIKKFTFAKLSGVITKNIQKTKSFSVNYDILKWIEEGFKKQLSAYKLTETKTIVVELPDEQEELIRNVFKRYDVDEKNPYGLYRAMVMVSVDNYFRRPKTCGDKKEEFLKVMDES